MYTMKKNPFERFGVIAALVIGRILIHLDVLWICKLFHIVFPHGFSGLYRIIRQLFGTCCFSNFTWYFNMLIPVLVVLHILVRGRRK